jgi:hypothetical protein
LSVNIIKFSDLSFKDEYITTISKQILDAIRNDILTEAGTSTQPLQNYVTKKKKPPSLLWCRIL